MIQQVFKEKAPRFKTADALHIKCISVGTTVTFLNGPEGKGMSQGWVLEVIATDSTYSSPLQQDLKVLQDREQDITTGSECKSD